MRKLYISDLHFDHANVIKFDQRPFDSVDEMNDKLIENWNNTVDKDDMVYILGDFCWKKQDRWLELLNQLSGQKTLIMGNHDLKQMSNSLKSKFCDIKEYKEITDDGRQVILCHYPIVCFKNHYYGAYHLYGHVHTTYEFTLTESAKDTQENVYDVVCNMYNVGCMMPYMNYTPKTLDEIIEGYKSYKLKGLT